MQFVWDFILISIYFCSPFPSSLVTPCLGMLEDYNSTFKQGHWSLLWHAHIAVHNSPDSLHLHWRVVHCFLQAHSIISRQLSGIGFSFIRMGCSPESPCFHPRSQGWRKLRCGIVSISPNHCLEVYSQQMEVEHIACQQHSIWFTCPGEKYMPCCINRICFMHIIYSADKSFWRSLSLRCEITNSDVDIQQLAVLRTEEKKREEKSGGYLNMCSLCSQSTPPLNTELESLWQAERNVFMHIIPEATLFHWCPASFRLSFGIFVFLHKLIAGPK